MRSMLVAAALVTALGTRHAAAQVQPFVAGGLAIPAGTTAELDEALPFGDASLGWQIEGGVALGFERGAVDVRVFGTYATAARDFDAFNRDVAEGGIDLRLDGTARVLGAGVGAAYYFPAELLPDVFPYVVATGGVYQQRHTTNYTGDDVVPGTESDVVRSTRIGAGGGVGLIWAPGRLRVFLESRLQALMASGEAPGYLIPIQLGVKLGGR
jgi:hypothetical protein